MHNDYGDDADDDDNNDDECSIVQKLINCISVARFCISTFLCFLLHNNQHPTFTELCLLTTVIDIV